MDHLAERFESSSIEACPIRNLFDLFLLGFSSSGQYPHDEKLSDLGLKIWLTIHEYSISSTTTKGSNLNSINFVHKQFIQLVYAKVFIYLFEKIFK